MITVFCNLRKYESKGIYCCASRRLGRLLYWLMSPWMRSAATIYSLYVLLDDKLH